MALILALAPGQVSADTAEEEEPTSTRPRPEDTDDDFTRQARLSWAKLIRRVYEIELLDQIA